MSATARHAVDATVIATGMTIAAEAGVGSEAGNEKEIVGEAAAAAEVEAEVAAEAGTETADGGGAVLAAVPPVSATARAETGAAARIGIDVMVVTLIRRAEGMVAAAVAVVVAVRPRGSSRDRVYRGHSSTIATATAIVAVLALQQTVLVQPWSQQVMLRAQCRLLR